VQEAAWPTSCLVPASRSLTTHALAAPSPPVSPPPLPPSPDTLLLDLHPNAKMILGTRNIAFMHGPSHKALRKSFLALFTRKALGLYIEKQDAVIREHLALWMEDPGAQEMRLKVWAMNAETSQSVFVGEWRWGGGGELSAGGSQWVGGMDNASRLSDSVWRGASQPTVLADEWSATRRCTHHLTAGCSITLSTNLLPTTPCSAPQALTWMTPRCASSSARRTAS
jgi:hypothetical protein